MFIPKAFIETDSDVLQAFIASHPLATVIAQTPDGIEASHLPLYLEGGSGDSELRTQNTESKNNANFGYLIGHMGKVNPLNDDQLLDAPWLVIFQDAGHYISPNWYPSKADNHKAVPTWNYRSVHITGNASLLTQAQQVIAILTRQTAMFESVQPVPWSLADAPDKYIQALCRAIVGIKIEITDIKAQFKLSQNKSAENKAGVVKGLKRVGSAEAKAMADLIAVDVMRSSK